MSEWKVQLQFRIRPALGREMEEFAAKERRKLDDLAELITEWAFAQLKTAGSIERLYKFQLKKRNEKQSKNTITTSIRPRMPCSPRWQG